MGNTSTKESRPPGSATSSTQQSGSRSGTTTHSSSSNATSKERRERREQKKKEAEGYQLIVDPKEMVDGGYLFPQGVYTGPQDFKCAVVRDLIIRRKLAPFYKGLETYSADMTDEELLDAVGGKPKMGPSDGSNGNLDAVAPPMPDDVNDLNQNNFNENGNALSPHERAAAQPLSASDGVTPSPASSATHTADTAKTVDTVDTVASDAVANVASGVQSIAISAPARSAPPPSSSSEIGPKSMPRDLFATIPEHTPVKGPIASGTSEASDADGANGANSSSGLNGSDVSRTRRRANTHSLGKSSKQLEKDAQTIWLYRNVHECPICFLLYPRLNNTRCCGQEICTECFVQIKRAAPHPPYTESPTSSPAESARSTPTSTGPPRSSELELVSEPACCPYCVLQNFGITFEAPPFEWGIPKPPPPRSSRSRANSAAGASLIGAPAAVTTSAKPRRPSFAHTHSDVVTIDQIRPDWESKLASARRRLARKAAAARALHQSSLLPPGASSSSSSHSRRRSEASQSIASAGSNSRHRRRSTLSDFVQATRTMSAAQTRELENQMMEEAIRQSLREV